MPVTISGDSGITTPDLTDTSLTSGRVVYAGASGNLTGSANLTFDGTNLTSATLKSVRASGSQPEVVIQQTGIASWSIYNPTSSTDLRFYNGSDLLTITSAGNLGLGVSPSAWNTIVPLQVKNASFAGFSNSAYMGSNFFYAGGEKYISSAPATLYVQDANIAQHAWYGAPSGTAGNAATFTQILAITKGGTLALEGNTPQTGVGITFPATQSASSNANTLDDYEEGTWTPSYGSGATSVTYGSVRDGHYRKIGSQVTIWFGIMTNSLTASASGLTITGLPFTASSGAGSNGTVNINLATRWVSGPPIVGSVNPSTTTIILYNSIAATGAGVDAVEVTTGNMSTGGSNNRNIVFATATYFV